MTIEITGKVEKQTDFWGEVVGAKLSIDPAEYKKAISHFDIGEKVTIQISNDKK